MRSVEKVPTLEESHCPTFGEGTSLRVDPFLASSGLLLRGCPVLVVEGVQGPCPSFVLSFVGTLDRRT